MKTEWNINNAKWLVPNKYPLESSEQAKELLEAGYTLINNQRYKVCLNDDGTQIMTNLKRMKKKNPYDFSHPYFWQILDDNYGVNNTTKMLDWNGRWFKLENWLLKMSNKLF